jgi:two-component system CheB/CheR fusion protein
MHKKMGYDESREDLTYEHWYAVTEDREMVLQRKQRFSWHLWGWLPITRANDGALVFIKSTGLYHYDKFGIAHTFTGITIDISEQKRLMQNW